MSSGSDPFFERMFATAGIGIYETSVDGRLLRANPALASMFGYPDAESMVAQVESVAKAVYADPAERDRFLRGIITNGRIDGVQMRARRLDGSLLSYSITAVGQFGPIGELTSIIGTISDVTDLSHARAQLEAVERDYRSIWEQATEAMYRNGADGRQLRANPALVALNGYETEAEMLAAMGEDTIDWYVEPGRRIEFLRLLIENGRVSDFDSEIYRHRTRERIWIRENAWVVRDEAGEILFHEGTAKEITSRRKAEMALIAANDALARANRAKSEFLANMSHELRTPLNAILGFSEVIRDQVMGPVDARYRNYAGDIHASGRHLLDLVDDILDLSRIEAGRLELDLAPLALADLFEEVVRLFETQMTKAGLEFGVHPAAEMPVIRADRRALKQVLLNLLSNALKFTPAPGRVDLTADVRSATVAITIADTGVGIPAHHRDRVFEPFVQIENPLSKKFAGSGLGLPIVKALVESQGGRVRLDSTAAGGTLVEICFPVAA